MWPLVQAAGWEERARTASSHEKTRHHEENNDGAPFTLSLLLPLLPR